LVLEENVTLISFVQENREKSQPIQILRKAKYREHSKTQAKT
jgi:hypothetical protein